MNEEQNDTPEPATPRRSLRRPALSEINEYHAIPNGGIGAAIQETPKSTSPDEQIILQRGPRRKPLTWSPYEYDKTKMLGPPREWTPEKSPSPRPDISSKLRRRLVLTPDRIPEMGETIANRLRSFTKQREAVNNRNKFTKNK